MRARADILRIARFIGADRRDHGLPWNTVDPFDDTHYAYQARGEDFIIYSCGADGETWTDDDIRYDSRAHALVPTMSSRPAGTAKRQ